MEKSSTEQRKFTRGRLPCLHDQPASQKPTWRQSTETRTDKATKKSNRQVKSPPRSSLLQHTDKSTKKSTGKSMKSTKILLKLPVESTTMKWTRWSPKRTSNDDWPSQAVSESMTLTDNYWLQDIFYRACGSYTQSSDSASALELGKYNHFRVTYVLGVYERDYTQLMYTIDGYDRCRQRMLPSMPSHERKLYHPDKFRQ